MSNNINVYVNDEHQLTLPAHKNGGYVLHEVLARVQAEQSVQPNSDGKIPVTIVGTKS